MAKQMMFDAAARTELKDGLGQLAAAVKVTMGPTGKNVLLQKSFGSPKVTKDGVSVSKEIELPEPFKNMGAKMVNEVASKTSDLVGDGTTTATVLAEAIYSEGLKRVAAGVNPVAVQRGVNKAAQVVVEYIESVSKKVKGHSDIAKVGAISANNNPEVGEILAEKTDLPVEKIEEIAHGEDQNLNIIAMQGEENAYRLRVGNYRVIYEIRDNELVLVVVKVGARGDVYK